jgi:hypothetical protein
VSLLRISAANKAQELDLQEKVTTEFEDAKKKHDARVTKCMSCRVKQITGRISSECSLMSVSVGTMLLEYHHGTMVVYQCHFNIVWYKRQVLCAASFIIELEEVTVYHDNGERV